MNGSLDKFTMKLDMKAFPEIKSYQGTLFHYTSANNIHSILNSGDNVVLWASRYDCLNDFSEGTLPEIRFNEVTECLKKENLISAEFYDLIHSIKSNRMDTILPITDHRIRPYRGEYDTYVTSFLENDDALALWNYYSKGSRFEGINIGVHAQLLIDSLEQRINHNSEFKINVFKVIYDADQQRDILSTILKELYAKFEPGDESSIRHHLSTVLASLKMLFKNKCFEHEKEIRVVVQVFKKYKSVFPVKYRTYAGYIIPYIELKFDKGAVCQITTGPMVGPDQQKKLQKAVLHEMLDNYGYHVCEKCSGIPVRY